MRAAGLEGSDVWDAGRSPLLGQARFCLVWRLNQNTPPPVIPLATPHLQPLCPVPPQFGSRWTGGWGWTEWP